MSAVARLALFATFGVIAATPVAETSAPNPPQLTQDLLQFLYPELMSRRLWLTITAVGDWPSVTGALLETGAKVWPKKVDGTFEAGGEVLSLWTQLDIYEHVFRIQARGGHVKSRELDAVRDFVRAHPTMSDDDFVEELRRRGAKFLPEQVSEPPIQGRLDRTPASLGQVVEYRSEFWVTERDRDTGLPTVAFLTWSTYAKSIHADGRPGCYSFETEPFGGTVTTIRSSC